MVGDARNNEVSDVAKAVGLGPPSLFQTDEHGFGAQPRLCVAGLPPEHPEVHLFSPSAQLQCTKPARLL